MREVLARFAGGAIVPTSALQQHDSIECSGFWVALKRIVQALLRLI